MSLAEFRRYLGDVAGFWPGVAITIVLSVALSARLAERLQARRAAAAMLIFGVGLIVSATLTPSRDVLLTGRPGPGFCDGTRMGPASLTELLAFGDPTFNVLLYVPLGVAIAWLPRRRVIVPIAAGAFVLPLVIETIQLGATGLGRACQTADILDNMTGVVVGLVLGVSMDRAWALSRRP